MDIHKTQRQFPLVSIITATYNSAKFIEDTYDSILKQTFVDWEWIITDDCSTDKTVEILKLIVAKDPRVKFEINNQNSGAAVSRNSCIARSKGEYIAFIDSDDLWHNDKLSKQIDFMSRGYDFTFTGYELIDENKKPLNKFIDSRPLNPLTYNEMLKKKATLGCSTVMLRKNAFSNIEMPLLRTGQDYALWLKLLRAGNNAHLLPLMLTQYRIVPNSISRNKYKKAKRQWEIYRKVEGIGFFSSSIYFIHYALRAIFR